MWMPTERVLNKSRMSKAAITPHPLVALAIPLHTASVYPPTCLLPQNPGITLRVKNIPTGLKLDF